MTGYQLAVSGYLSKSPFKYNNQLVTFSTSTDRINTKSRIKDSITAYNATYPTLIASQTMNDDNGQYNDSQSLPKSFVD